MKQNFYLSRVNSIFVLIFANFFSELLFCMQGHNQKVFITSSFHLIFKFSQCTVRLRIGNYKTSLNCTARVENCEKGPIFFGKIPHFLGKLQKFLPFLRARNFEIVPCKSIVFHGNSLHCKGPILEAKFWAESMVILRSSAPG